MRATNRSSRAARIVAIITRHWMLWFSLLFGVFIGLPFLAPLFMHIGWALPARAIYFIYSFLCHQLPDRSFFFFGIQVSYRPQEIAVVWPSAGDLMHWRSFIGTESMGWKVAWSDRMVSMYTSTLFFAWLWWPLRRRLPALHWIGFVLLLLPMTLDGFSHMASDVAGLHNGFRYTNYWLAALTQNSLPETFYQGDAVGSFNSWMRLLTGAFFGLGVVWFAFPILDRSFTADILYQDAREKLTQYALGPQSNRSEPDFETQQAAATSHDQQHEAG